MTTTEGQLTWAAKRATGVANSVEANERRRRREPPIIDWDARMANLLDILEDIYDERVGERGHSSASN